MTDASNIAEQLPGLVETAEHLARDAAAARDGIEDLPEVLRELDSAILKLNVAVVNLQNAVTKLPA